MSNARRTKRTALLYYLEVQDRTTGKPLGRLVNISAEGLLLCAAEPLVQGTVYHMRLILPEEVCGKKHLDLDARSIWCKPDVNPSLRVCGLEMLDIGNRDVETIVNLIVDYGFPD